MDTIADLELGGDRLDLSLLLANPPRPGGSYVGEVSTVATAGGTLISADVLTGGWRDVVLLEGIDVANTVGAVEDGSLF